MNEPCNLLIATTNDSKFNELSSLLSGCPFDFVSLVDIDISTSVAETGSTFAQNAVQKASAYSLLSGMLTLADDSGLEIEALDGEPGIYSARYAGPEADDSQRIAFLLQKMNGLCADKRDAHFSCTIAIAIPNKPPVLFSGKCKGRIISEPRGENGFGYDPIFLLPELGKTMAELSFREKNRLSHRAQAAKQASIALKKIHAQLLA